MNSAYGNPKFENLTWRLENGNGPPISLDAVKKSTGDYSDKNLKNDNYYEVYWLDMNNNSLVDTGDYFKVKAPSDGYYKVVIMYEDSTVFQSSLKHY